MNLTSLRKGINQAMYDNNWPLRLIEVFQLNDNNFDCRRWVKLRTYVFKIIIIPTNLYQSSENVYLFH